MRRKYDLFGIGTPVIDHFVVAPQRLIGEKNLREEATNYVSGEELDRLREGLSSSILLVWPGDNARNVCEGVAFMGGRTAYAGRVAGDREGRMFKDVLRRLGIDPFLEFGPGRTGRIITLITPDLKRTFVADLGNGEDYSLVPEEGIKSSCFLFLTSITLLRGKIARVAQESIFVARRYRTKVSISLESSPMIRENRSRLLELIRKSDVLFGNEDEISALTGESARMGAGTLAREVPVVCLKMGKRGSLVFTEGRVLEVAPFPASVKDPTGAGDFYAAGFLYGMIRGNSPEDCGRMGSKLASMVIENLGATLAETGRM
ncbi:MAG: adenosine kinase [Candidatus Hadarchaeales archaeon]